MTMINPVNPQNLSKQHSCHVGGVYTAFPEEGGCHLDVMSRLEGYGCSSEAETNLIKCLGGGGGGGGGGSDSEEEDDHLVIVVGHQMADQEDDSRTTDQSVNEATASTSLIKDATAHRHHHQEDHNIIDKDDKWLQLSIGGLTAAAAQEGRENRHNLDIQQDNQSSTRGARPGMIELDLLPGSTSTNSEHELKLKSSLALAPSPSMFHMPEFGASPRPLANIITSGAASSSSSNYYSTNTSLFMQQYPANILSFPSYHHHHGEIEFNWGAFRPVQRNIGSVSTPLSSSSSRLVPTAGPYFARPFLLHPGLGLGTQRPSIDFRVIDPPRRPASGIWFMLQASQNQAKEPFLPQIPKSFLRIKDGRMTIGIVIKYLVNKLKLENESEVEIKCRGQQILPTLTLQHVRDCIWNTDSPPHLLTLLPDSSTTDHIMVLHYARSP